MTDLERASLTIKYRMELKVENTIEVVTVQHRAVNYLLTKKREPYFAKNKYSNGKKWDCPYLFSEAKEALYGKNPIFAMYKINKHTPDQFSQRDISCITGLGPVYSSKFYFLRLQVPLSQILLMPFYDWADNMYVESGGFVDKEGSNSESVKYVPFWKILCSPLVGDGDIQALLPRIEPDWVCSSVPALYDNYIYKYLFEKTRAEGN